MFRLSTCSLCPAWLPGGCDGETGQRQLDTRPFRAEASLLAAAMRCDASTGPGWTELDPSCGERALMLSLISADVTDRLLPSANWSSSSRGRWRCLFRREGTVSRGRSATALFILCAAPTVASYSRRPGDQEKNALLVG